MNMMCGLVFHYDISSDSCSRKCRQQPVAQRLRGLLIFFLGECSSRECRWMTMVRRLVAHYALSGDWLLEGVSTDNCVAEADIPLRSFCWIALRSRVNSCSCRRGC